MIDLTIACNLKMADGIGRQGVGLLSAVKDDLKVNILPTSSLCDLTDVPLDLQNYFQRSTQDHGKITFWTYILGLHEGAIAQHKNLKSPIKLAYSMFESDRIPNLWVRILNSYYDAVVVPDSYLISVYENSGVKIPIFVLPLGIIAEHFLNTPPKTKSNDPFIFGMSAGFWERKNHIKLFEAFTFAFGDNADIKLKLHGRFGSARERIEDYIYNANFPNVELISEPFTQQEYFDWFSSLDAYVFPSQGEGFSITPREALALGIPCILSNNSVHRTLLDSGFFIPLKAEEKTPAKYEVFGNQEIGSFYDCTMEDLAHEMRNLYHQYEEYLEIAQKGREWARQYCWSELRPYYLSLFQPQEIRLGNENKIEKEYLEIKNEKLYQKYKKVFEK
jgi:glycosyltransferase involved in cell wall biosynthesis